MILSPQALTLETAADKLADHLSAQAADLRSQGSPRVDEAGLIVCWYGSVEDMEELKLKEAGLLKRQSASGGRSRWCAADITIFQQDLRHRDLRVVL